MIHNFDNYNAIRINNVQLNHLTLHSNNIFTKMIKGHINMQNDCSITEYSEKRFDNCN